QAAARIRAPGGARLGSASDRPRSAARVFPLSPAGCGHRAPTAARRGDGTPVAIDQGDRERASRAPILRRLQIPMKKLALSIAFISAATLAGAQEPKTPETQKPTTPAPQPKATTAHKAKPASHSVKGEVVSADVEKKTISFKNDKGEDVTWPAEGTAQSSL